MQFFSHGRIWNTDEAELLGTSPWRECHIDTSPDWQRNHYYRTKDGRFFSITEVEERPGFITRLFGAKVQKMDSRWTIFDSSDSAAFSIQSDFGASAQTMGLIRRLKAAA